MKARVFPSPEPLEARIAPATLDILGGAVTYTAGAGINNSLTLSISGANYSFNDTGETITLTAAAAAAGFTGGGTNTVLGLNTTVSSITVNLGDQSDQFALAGLTDPLQVNDGAGTDSIFVTGAVNVEGALQLGAESITVNAAISGATTATLAGDTMAINSTIIASTRVALQGLAVTREISLGTEDATRLSLTDAEVDLVTAPILRIGVNVGGHIEVNAAITPANTATLSLIGGSGSGSGTGITETAGGSIVVANLSLSGRGVAFDSAGNDVGTLAASVVGLTSNFSFTDADDVIIGTVDGVPGLNASPGTYLSINAGATTQTAGASISGDVLLLLGAGPFTLNNANNSPTKLAANTAGPISYTSAVGFSVGSVNGTNGIVTDNSAIALTAIDGNLTVTDTRAGADIDAGTGSLTLTA